MQTLKRLIVGIAVCLSSTIVTAQTPVFSSYSSASAVLFLDFDGHTTNGASWNVEGSLVCRGSGLNATQITEIYNRVAEDYRPFNLNVTTDSTKYKAAPVAKRMRMIITETSEWYGASGGVALAGSFTWGDDTPAFVFSKNLNYNVKNISEAVSHEAGHTFGLYHQSVYDASCAKISDYNYGNGSGEIGWAPIMGVGYYQNLTLWNNGPNSFGCDVIQNDLAVITSNGFSYRTDDHGNTFAAATAATFSPTSFTVNGVVEKSSDMDMFKFTISKQGRFLMRASPFSVATGNLGSNLDMQVSLYNGSQTLIRVYNPGTELSVSADTTLNAGTYYVKVEGRGNIYAPNYASLGSYTFQGALMNAVLPLRRLELQGRLQPDQKHQLNWIIDADEKVTAQSLEASHDGITFTAAGSVTNDDRAYTTLPSFSGNIQYRVKVTFDNGQTYYSNIVTLRSTGNEQTVKLAGTLVTGNSLRVISTGRFDYVVCDMNGKLIRTGSIMQGTTSIDLPGMANGVYLIKFVQGSVTYTERFMKQ